MLRTRVRQPVDPNPAICGRSAPLRLNQLLFEKPLEGGIERTFFDLKQVIGGALDVLRECVAVQGLPFQRPENHHLQGARKEVSLRLFGHARRMPVVVGLVSLGLDQNSIGSEIRQVPGNMNKKCRSQAAIFENSERCFIGD